ncbi:MAG: DOPA 4,5-dioxygenase family protein [Hyphomicrobiales bacterium]|nr:DOPA 4,5-dioxygenase family protein [Hyphomicrobiales bacterium]
MFDQIFPYLALNRNGLVIFTRPNASNAQRDNRYCAIWMGNVKPIDLGAPVKMPTYQVGITC